MKVNVLLDRAAKALPAGNPVRAEIETALAAMKVEHAARAQQARATMRENLKQELLAEIAAEAKAGKGVKPATPPVRQAA